MTNAAPLVAKKSRGLAGIAAVGACAACCALPLLAAAGMGGSVFSGVAGLIRPGADLLMAGVVGVGVLGVMAWRARAARSAACDTVCATDGGCGCSAAAGGGSIYSTPSPRAEEPIVCTADLADKPTVQGQLDGYRAAFAHLLRVERFEGGARWVFAKRPSLDLELRNLAEKEHQCCSFFKFDVRADRDTLVWETTAHESAAKVLDEFARLPERLQQHTRDHETQAIKQAVGDAGLIFAADASRAK
jgi:mercuric ion transport protein